MATRISISQCRVRGESHWRVRHWENGKPKRRFFKSAKGAKAYAGEIKVQLDRDGEIWRSLAASERERLIAAYNEARRKGVDLFDLIHKTDKITESPSLDTAIKELIQAKRSAGRSEVYVLTLQSFLESFANGRQSLKIDAVTLADVERFLDTYSIDSRSTLRSRLSALFGFAVRRGYRADNPCARLERLTIARKPVETFTVKQFQAAVKWLLKRRPEGLAWFALSTCCGLRPEEAEKTTKADIHFKEGFVRVEAQTSKVRARRVVYPKTEAMKFLQWALKRGGRLPLDPQTRKRIIAGTITKGKRSKALRDAVGFKKWPKDITRHTAASYWLACKGETVAHVSKMLGHSEKVCESRYKAVKTQAEAEGFWKAVEYNKKA